MIQDTSEFKFYSLGYAAGNLIFGQKELEVVPSEKLSQLDGEVADTKTPLEATGKDADGNTYSTKIQTANTIKATWIALDPHSPFPSLIRRGERVIIFRVGDSDKFYWHEMGIDKTTRRRDIRIIAVPNSPNEDEDSLTPETAYYFEINTVDKQVTMMTNKHDGEPFAYAFQLNTKDGVFTLQDDAGQFFQLVSKDERWVMQNASNSEIKMEKTKILFKALDEVWVDTKLFKVTSETTDIKTTTYTAKATQYNINTGTYSLQGSNATMNINIATAGTLTNNGMNVGGPHSHMEQGDGRPVGPPF